MSKYLVKIDELSNENVLLAGMINNIEEAVYGINNAKENIMWQGPAKEEFWIKYIEYAEELMKMVENLHNCLKVTKTFENNFNSAYEEIRAGMAKLEKDVIEK